MRSIPIKFHGNGGGPSAFLVPLPCPAAQGRDRRQVKKHKCGSIPARSLIRAASAATHRDRELHTDTFVHARRHGHTRTHTPGTNAQRSRPARLLSPARPFSSPRFAGHSLRAPSRAPPWPRGLAAVCPPQGRLRAVRSPGFLMNGHSPHVGPTPARATGTQCWILPLSLPWSGFPFLYNVWLSQRKAESQLARPSHPASQGSGNPVHRVGVGWL